MNPKELEDRLVSFSVLIHEVVLGFKYSDLGKELSQQLIRSSLSPALNYGEAQGAESRRDFIHKMKICSKELLETHISLKVAQKANLSKGGVLLNDSIQECNELIAIFVSSIKTAEGK